MKKESEQYVIKASGERMPFDKSKLIHSLQKAGANDQIIDSIMNEIVLLLHENITTREIYKLAFSKLKKKTPSFAAKYKLKKAIFELGPSGFPFEKFVSEILKKEGYKTQTGILVRGRCVNHEVDVVAERDNEHYMIECKFHGVQGNVCNVKVPLYIHSRFMDVEQMWKEKPGHETKFHQGWIVTNTKFTLDAIQYGKCSGLNLIAWDYPRENGLKDRIDRLGLHPITSLTTLTLHEKSKFLEREMVLCMELCKHPELLGEIGINEQRHKKILHEAHELCGI